MAKITIRNVGAISEIEMKLKKVNVIMGPQSSGKSTITKIISYCRWVEKRCILDGKYYKDDVNKMLLTFHRLDKNYFSENSFFEYESDFIKITYQGKKLKDDIVIKDDAIKYEKAKNIYIPSERNFVSTIPNLGKYNETNDNIMSFVYDWYTAKSKFKKKNPLPILNFNIDFYYIENRELDMLVLKEKGIEIPLPAGSSGLQSITPLVVNLEYLTNNFYKEDYPLSVNERNTINRYKSEIKNELEVRRTKYHKTNFIIEEPEQNLFPETQRDLIYSLLNKINSDRNHSLLLTTHSPYILYAINNCMMGKFISEKLTESEKNEFVSKDSWISPEYVNIYEINVEEGTIHSIKHPQTGTVDKHYFNGIMNNIMDEYYNMLNFYTNEE